MILVRNTSKSKDVERERERERERELIIEWGEFWIHDTILPIQ